tara:strand:- start:1558 stop:2121 length:564 start_codon:yes stop_codon:yes gene_type:complete
MRIISGSLKGRKILDPKDLNTRPLKDLTKESIFNVINHSNKFEIIIKKSTILDIFSGVGSFGIECLSRGADNVTFIENYKEALLVLKRNLLDLKLNDYRIIEKNAYDNNTLTELDQKFDLIFLDPPYKHKNLEILLNNIQNKVLLKENGIIVLHRHKDTKDSFPTGFKILEEKNYGISRVIFISYLY